MKNRRQFLGGLAALGVFAIAGCGGGGDTIADGTTGEQAAAGDAVKSVTIGYLPNIVMPQPLVGLQDGLYEKNVPGVKFAGKDYPAGPAVIEALRSGVIDIAYTGPYPPLKGFAKDGDIVLLCAAGSGGTELSVAKNSAIKSVKDLKGKTVAVNQLGSTVDAMVRHVLIEGGLQPGKDVKITPIPPAEQGEALARGTVAAVAAPAPWPIVTNQKGGRALLDWKAILDDGKYLQGVAFTTKKYAAAHPEFIKQFVAAHRKITDDLNADRAQADKEIVSAWEKVTRKKMEPSVASEAFKTIQFVNDSTPEEWNRAQDIAVETGIMRKKVALDGYLYGQ